MQGQTGHLCGIDHAHLDHVAIFVAFRVEAEVVFLGVADLADYHRAFEPRVISNLPQRLFERALDDVDAGGLVAIGLQLVERGDAAQQGHAASGHDAFLDRRARGVHGVFHASFLFLELGFRRRAHLDHGHAAHELGEALLQLLAVVVGSSVVDLRADLLHAPLDLGGLAASLDEGGVVLIDGDFLGSPEVFHLHVFELDAQVLGDGLAAGQGGDVFQHGLAAIAKARRLHGRALKSAAQLVDHQGGERFAFHVFRHDHERLAHLGNLLEQRQQVLHRADLFLVDQNADILEHALHALGIGDEVGREVAAVELHAFHDFQRGFHGAALFHGDHAVLAHFLHGLGDDAADLLVVIGTDGAHLRDHLAFDVAVQLANLVDASFHGAFDAALESGRARPCRDGPYAFTEDGLRQHGSGGGAVAGDVGGLRGHLPHHLRAHVLQRIPQFDLLGHRHSVLGNDRRTKLLLDHSVAPLGAKRDLHGVSQQIDAAQNGLAGIFPSHDLLCHCILLRIFTPSLLLSLYPKGAAINASTLRPWPPRPAWPEFLPHAKSGTLRRRS